MKRRVEQWTVEKLSKERTRISFPEYQREKSLWPVEKKRLLIDSLQKDIDVPKLYFNLLSDNSIEVIDGQQRLWSIWEFLDGEYTIQSGAKNVTFEQMSPSQKRTIQNYQFQVTVFEAADDEYLRELFIRLQLGLLLNTGEKLHAATGRMKGFVFSTLANDRFVKALGIPGRRYAKETLCAQIAINSFTKKKVGQFARTRYDDLVNFFDQYAAPTGEEEKLFKERATAIPKTFEILWSIFGQKTRDLRNRSYVLSIFLLVEDVPPPSSEYGKFLEFAFRLWTRLREEAKKGMDRSNRELYSFQSLLSSAPGEQYQIERRHEKLKEYYAHYVGRGKIKGD